MTKLDLAAVVDFDRTALVGNIESIRPGVEIVEVSAKTCEGMGAWIALLKSRAAALAVV